MIAAIGMYFHTMTPLGRMANACRDNHERAQFVGYDPRIVRFLQFALSGFFAGIAGGLYAITYEIVTFDAVAAPLAANALLMAYIGGATTFFGPVLGAILITLLQSGVSLMSNSWLIYVGVLFIAMVTFAPDRPYRHRPGARADRARRPAASAGAALPAHPCAGACRAVRLRGDGGAAVVPHHRHGGRQASRAVRLRRSTSPARRRGWSRWSACWPAASGCAVEARHFSRVWDGLIDVARAGMTAPSLATDRRAPRISARRDHPRRQHERCRRRAPCADRSERRRQDDAVQPDQRPLSDNIGRDPTGRDAARRLAAASHQPAGPVAQLPDHLDLSPAQRLREHPLQPALEPRLSLFVLACARSSARPEPGDRTSAGGTQPRRTA